MNCNNNTEPSSPHRRGWGVFSPPKGGWRGFLLLLLSFSCAVFAQERLDSVAAIVRDAETGEPVPYVSVYVSSSCGTISNYDGEFCLRCLPSDVLRISSIGYRSVSYRASELPPDILMQSSSTTLRELTVVGTDDVLYRLVLKMQKEAKKHKKKVGHYFFRLATRYPGTDELAEAFLSAKSCVQLRDITFHSGNRGYLSEGELGKPDLKGLSSTNLHYFLRLAPVLVNFDIWGGIVVPADYALERRGVLWYDVSCVAFTDEDGAEIRKIHLEGKDSILGVPYLEGTLYVDYRNCRLMRFEGQMKKLYLRTYDNARRRAAIDTLSCDIRVDYRYDHGFTEIANMSGTVVKNKVQLRYLLFNLGDKEMAFRRAKRVGTNMLRTIDEVGFDSTLWASSDIVKRTKREERVAFGDSTFFRSKKSRYEVAPSPQEAGANAYLRDALRQLKGNTMQLHRGLPPKE